MLKRTEKFVETKYTCLNGIPLPFWIHGGKDPFIIKHYNPIYFVSWHFKNGIKFSEFKWVLTQLHVFLSMLVMALICVFYPSVFWKSHHWPGKKSFLEHACFLTSIYLLPPFGNMFASGIISPSSLFTMFTKWSILVSTECSL